MYSPCMHLSRRWLWTGSTISSSLTRVVYCWHRNCQKEQPDGKNQNKDQWTKRIPISFGINMPTGCGVYFRTNRTFYLQKYLSTKHKRSKKFYTHLEQYLKSEISQYILSQQQRPPLSLAWSTCMLSSKERYTYFLLLLATLSTTLSTSWSRRFKTGLFWGKHS